MHSQDESASEVDSVSVTDANENNGYSSENFQIDSSQSSSFFDSFASPIGGKVKVCLNVNTIKNILLSVIKLNLVWQIKKKKT